MKRILIVIALLALALPAMAKGNKHKPTPEPTVVVTLVVTPAPLAPPWDKVMLKDGQKGEGKIRGYDAFFLDFELKNSKLAHLPWMEIAELVPAEFSGDMAMMRQYIKNENVEVRTFIAPKSPGRAAGRAFWPGILLHGYGFKEAGNNEMFLSLAGTHIFAYIVQIFGAIRIADTSLSIGERDSAATLLNGASALSTLAWIIDLAGAPMSAQSFNQEHGLTLSAVPTQNGALVSAQLRF